VLFEVAASSADFLEGNELGSGESECWNSSVQQNYFAVAVGAVVVGLLDIEIDSAAAESSASLAAEVED